MKDDNLVDVLSTIIVVTGSVLVAFVGTYALYNYGFLGLFIWGGAAAAPFYGTHFFRTVVQLLGLR